MRHISYWFVGFQSGGSSSQGSKDISEVVKKLERHGPGSDRLSAMKAAFRSQYTSQVGYKNIRVKIRVAIEGKFDPYIPWVLLLELRYSCYSAVFKHSVDHHSTDCLLSVPSIVRSHMGTNHHTSLCDNAAATPRCAEAKYRTITKPGQPSRKRYRREEEGEKEPMGIIARPLSCDYFVYTTIQRHCAKGRRCRIVLYYNKI